MGGGEQLSTKHLMAQARHWLIATTCFLRSVRLVPSLKWCLFPCETIGLPLLKVLPKYEPRRSRTTQQLTCTPMLW